MTHLRVASGHHEHSVSESDRDNIVQRRVDGVPLPSFTVGRSQDRCVGGHSNKFSVSVGDRAVGFGGGAASFIPGDAAIFRIENVTVPDRHESARAVSSSVESLTGGIWTHQVPM